MKVTASELGTRTMIFALALFLGMVAGSGVASADRPAACVDTSRDGSERIYALGAEDCELVSCSAFGATWTCNQGGSTCTHIISYNRSGCTIFMGDCIWSDGSRTYDYVNNCDPESRVYQFEPALDDGSSF